MFTIHDLVFLLFILCFAASFAFWVIFCIKNKCLSGMIVAVIACIIFCIVLIFIARMIIAQSVSQYYYY